MPNWFDTLTETPAPIKRGAKHISDAIAHSDSTDSKLGAMSKGFLGGAIEGGASLLNPVSAASMLIPGGMAAKGAGKVAMQATPLVNNIKRGYVATRAPFNTHTQSVKNINHLPQIPAISHYKDAVNLGKSGDEAIDIASSGNYQSQMRDNLRRLFGSRLEDDAGRVVGYRGKQRYQDFNDPRR